MFVGIPQMVESQRGNYMIVLNGKTYRLYRTVLDKSYWICSKGKNCRARLKSDHGQIVVVNGRHTCGRY